MKFIKKWFKENKKQAIALLLILLIGSFFRFYKIGGYMTFLGDEGRDAIIVRRLLVNADLILIGPGTSIGNMFLGPLYYYFIAPGLLLSFFSPVGPSATVALTGVATIFLVWLVADEWFGKPAGLVASFLYAISPTVINFSKSSWNPNIMPFFALLTIYSVWRVWKYDNFKFLIVLAISLAFVLQSHYLGLLLVPALGLIWLISAKNVIGTKQLTNFKRYSVLALLIFLFLMSPLLIFDLRHDFVNYKAVKLFFTERQTTVSARPWTGLPGAWPIFVDISTRLIAGKDEFIGRWAALGMAGSLLWVIGQRKNIGKRLRPFLLLFLWIGVGLIGLGVYKQQIYDHYYGFLFPAPFILVGGIASVLIAKASFRGVWLVTVALVFLAYFSIIESPLRFSPNNQLQRTEEVASLIRADVGEEKYNLAVIAERNYEDAYQFFLEKWGTGVVDIDAQRVDETITNQLYVVCELQKDECQPTTNPKTEVANFGWSVVEREWDVAGVTVYRLIHPE